MLHRTALLLFLVLSLVACSTPSPYTRASVQQLPRLDSAVLAVVDVDSLNPYFPAHGSGPEAKEATAWLHGRGFTILERSAIARVIAEQKWTLLNSEATVLKVGHMLGVTEIIFLSAVGNAVDLRSVDVETGRILWIAGGRYDGPCSSIGELRGFQYHCFPADLVAPALEKAFASVRVAGASVEATSRQ